MEFDIILGGLGGQGIKLASELLAWAAAEEGRNVYQNAIYGGEMRGGSIQCTVVIADREIGSPVRDMPWGGLAMDRRTAAMGGQVLRPGGLLIVNASMVSDLPDRPDALVFPMNTRELAEKAGSSQVTTMVALGAFAALSRIVGVESLLHALGNLLPPHRRALADVNRRALLIGAGLDQISSLRQAHWHDQAPPWFES